MGKIKPIHGIQGDGMTDDIVKLVDGCPPPGGTYLALPSGRKVFIQDADERSAEDIRQAKIAARDPGIQLGRLLELLKMCNCSCDIKYHLVQDYSMHAKCDTLKIAKCPCYKTAEDISIACGGYEDLVSMRNRYRDVIQELTTQLETARMYGREMR